ncbi:MAG: nucleotidyltransferase family protein [Clostridia bacterium]|nr:nucleotidyltransferase family protein [Clostridia bacterium]
MRIGCVLLAAGCSHRFGGNKLLSDFCGQPLAVHAAAALPQSRFYRTVAVTQADTRPLLLDCGLECLLNDAPERGISSSIRIGLGALADADAAMFCVCDQPLLRPESVERVLDMWLANPSRIVALAFEGVKGNPVVFPRGFFPELAALAGDRGGSAVIRRHPDALLLCEAGSAAELADADTALELAALAATHKNGGKP